VDKLFAMDQLTSSTQLSIPLGSVNKLYSIYLLDYVGGLHMAVLSRSKSVGAGLNCGIGCTPALSVTHSTAAVAGCGLWRYVLFMHSPFTYFR